MVDYQPYHKINAIFKRHMSGPQKGKLIVGDWAVPEIEYLANNEWEFTEKVDGTNIRVYFDGATVDIRGRTDNAQIPQGISDFIRANLPPRKFEEAGLKDIVLYGEGYGPKIQSGGLYRQDQSFVLFDVKVGPWWLDRKNVDDIADKLGIESVPVLGYGTLYDAISIVRTGMTTAGDRVVVYGPGHLTSNWGDFEAEGIVARPTVSMFSRKGERIIAKIKARDFRKTI
jgi:hypothetical protein